MQIYKIKNGTTLYRAARDGKGYIIQSSTDGGRSWHPCTVFDRRYQWPDDAEDTLARNKDMVPVELKDPALENPTTAGHGSPADAGPATQGQYDAEAVCLEADPKKHCEDESSKSAAAQPADHPDDADVGALTSTAGFAMAAFDYSGMDVQTTATLQVAEKLVKDARKNYLSDMAEAVNLAHEALCSTDATQCRNGDGTYGGKAEQTFGAWCEYIGISRKTGERLVQVYALLSGSEPEEQAVLEQAPATLLYAAAKPSAPAEARAAVKSGDITSVPEYKALLKELEAEKAARQTAEERAESAAQKCYDLGKRANGLDSERSMLINKERQYIAKIRELESRPIDVAVAEPDEATIEKYRQEGENRGVAKMQDVLQTAQENRKKAGAEAETLRQQLNAIRPDADDCQRIVDALFDAVESFRAVLRNTLKAAALDAGAYTKVVGRALDAAGNIRDTITACAPAGYEPDNDSEEDFF